MTVTIRSANPADVPAIIGLMRELAEHEGHLHFFQLTAEALTQYCFGSPARLGILVAVDGDEIVGYATYMAQLSPWAAREYLFVDDVYVVAKQRGTGVGRLLMDQVGAVASARDLEVRWHVETGNVSAQRFYRSLGAELRSRFIAYWSTEAIRAPYGIASR